MQLSTLNDRIKNIEERINKKEKTIASKTKLLAKKEKIIVDAGYDLNDRESIKQNSQMFWVMFDIDNLKEDLVRLPKEIEELKKTLKNYQEQLVGQVDKENTYSTEVPEVLKALENELVEKWTAFDIKRKNQIQEAKRSLNYDEYRKMFSKYEFNVLAYKSDEDIRKDNEKDAKGMVMNLYNRIKDITGEITDWSGITLAPGARGSATLNGIVIGNKGKCKVESIYAEGPVQRLHVRVLTKEIN